MRNYWFDQSLKMFSNGVDWVIAPNAERAKEISMHCCGYGEDDLEDCPFVELNPDEDFTLFHEDDDVKEVKTARQWVDDFGEGYLASSEF